VPKFIYKAKKNPTDIVEGMVVADSRDSAIQRISRKGYYLVSIDEYTKSDDALQRKFTGFLQKVTLTDITNFTRQLSDLLESGLTIVKALDTLHAQTENKKLKAVILEVKDYCVDGNPLSEALARHPRIFPNLFVSMIKSGEAGGTVARILKRLSDFYDAQLEIRTKIKTALAYPILMATVGVITIIVLMTFVIPRMMDMFGDLGQSLPLPTLVLVGISSAIKNYWWLALIIVSVGILVFLKMYETPEGRKTVDRLKITMPLFGPLIKKIEIARFARTLATLLSNGVPILESLRIVRDTVNNIVIKEEITKAQRSVKDGKDLAGAFSGSSVIPVLVVNMIAVGEEGGRVERALAKVAEGYERQSDAAIKVMMSLLEPTLILVLGLVVGFIVISMLLPIFEINFLVR
jgi:type II secretion system protein F